MQRQRIKRLTWFLGGIALSFTLAIGMPALALIDSIGENGIDAQRLQMAPYNLTGRKIAIGQVELGRPAENGLDKAATSNRAIHIGGLFRRDNTAQPNDDVDEHAARVASIMVSRDKLLPGIAPDAVLYSSAIGSDANGGQPQECTATQTVALRNSGDVRAINFSFGESLANDPRPNPVLDGNALLTRCVDWSARVHDVLYAIAGNQGRGGYPIPTDSYNGMTIAYSMPVNGRYSKVDFFSLGSEPPDVIGRDPASERNVGGRRSVSLVAPGREVETIAPDGSPVAGDIGGTSFAAPHVVGTVALLQEFGDAQIRSSKATKAADVSTSGHWTLDARQEEVMKAVLLNSTDKLQDEGDGLRLGMSRTLLNLANQSWLESDAYRDEQIPLDAQMGTGHLNALRAYQQFSPGQWSAEAAVPAIGWDYRTLDKTGEAAPKFRDYLFEQPLQANSFIAATLVWNRRVDLQDKNDNDQFDADETFDDRGLNNLDLYLMRAEDNELGDRIWASTSKVDSIEHLFHPIPQTGRYKIRVVYRDRVNEPTQAYALAWWTDPAH